MKWAVTLFLLLATSLCGADITLQDITQRFPDAAVVRADFQQQQHLSILPAPLTASGDLIVARGKGMLWRVRTPFKSETKLVDGRLYSNDQAAALPGGEQFANRLMDVLSGNFKALKPYFNLDVGEQNGQWQVTLTPRADALAKVLTRIRVEGNDGPSFFRLDYPSGDYSITRLNNLEYSDRLSDDEKHRFVVPR